MGYYVNEDFQCLGWHVDVIFLWINTKRLATQQHLILSPDPKCSKVSGSSLRQPSGIWVARLWKWRDKDGNRNLGIWIIEILSSFLKGEGGYGAQFTWQPNALPSNPTKLQLSPATTKGKYGDYKAINTIHKCILKCYNGYIVCKNIILLRKVRNDTTSNISKTSNRQYIYFNNSIKVNF